MSSEKSSYKQIMKATSIFGGVQVINIIIGIIRSKFIAVFLGPAGMGISGLLTSTTGLIAGLSNMGLGSSAVKNLAEAYNAESKDNFYKVVTIFKQLIFFTGILGSLITLIFCKQLSLLAFGNDHYTMAFALLSITLFINQISIGQNAILQSTQQLKFLAKSGLIGSFLGLIISVPIYYFYKTEGIVAAIISSSVISLILTNYFTNKLAIKAIKIKSTEVIAEGRGMIKMGIMLSISGFIVLGASYIIRAYISNTGSLDDVGLYNAGFAIINSYVGMVFTAMATDYYPRLSAVASNNNLANKLINEQGEIALIILAPILCTFVVFIQYVVILLYSEKFIAINGMIQWAALGMYFKAISWSIAFIMLAKGASKMFFWNELLANAYLLIFNIIGYKLGQLNGLGISFLVGYFVYFVQIYLVTNQYYGFKINNEFKKLFFIQFMLGVLCYLVIAFLKSPYNYLLGTIPLTASVIYSIILLNSRINLKNLLKR